MCKSIFLILRIKIIPVMVARRVVENVSAHYVRVFHNISCIKKSESPNHQPSDQRIILGTLRVKTENRDQILIFQFVGLVCSVL